MAKKECSTNKTESSCPPVCLQTAVVQSVAEFFLGKLLEWQPIGVPEVNILEYGIIGAGTQIS